MRRHLINIGLILLLTAVAVAGIAIPRINIFGFERGSGGPLGLRLGLDVQGGTHLVYQTEEEDPTDDEMRGLVSNIRRRIDAFGVIEPVLQRMGDRRILIQLPGVSDIEEAKDLIGATAELDFRELALGDPVPVPVYVTELDAEGNPVLDDEGSAVLQLGDEGNPVIQTDEEGNPVFELDEEGNLVLQPGPITFRVATGEIDGVQKELTGAFLRQNAAGVDTDPRSPGEFQVILGLTGEGGELFEQITTRVFDDELGLGRTLGIFIDGAPISLPEVLAPILSGQGAVITGLDLDRARLLAIQLNSGALPLAVELVQERDVNPILGAAALDQGIRAALVGMGLVLLFIVFHYRLAGLTAAFALVIFTVLLLSIFKLMPVTLTLSGLAAFILSIGMAVDANVLIFARLNEELKAGRSLGAAIEMGFDRAWPAIRDGNFSTLITCLILFWFADRLGASFVMGFAITLGIGVLVSMFTAIVITRSFLRSYLSTALARRVNLFHV